MIGWFQNLHPKFTCRDNVVKELNLHLDIDEKLDLHIHTTKFSTIKQTHSTNALVLTCDHEQAHKMKNLLYKMNIENRREKHRWTQTGHWFFVPFSKDGPITSVHIAKMIQHQNICIGDSVNITVSGITNIKVHVKKPDSFATTTFDLWIMPVKSLSGDQFFHSIERDSNDFYHFCTMSKLKVEAC
eukprot:1237871-Ditylum_brightwellii.AAC.1